MKNYKLYIAIGIVSVVLILLVNKFKDTSEPIRLTETITETPKDIPIEETTGYLPRQSKYYVPLSPIPNQFARYHELTHGDRLRIATDLMENKNLPKETIDFFRAEIFNRGQMDSTRNNMANAICWQRNKDPELHLLFIKMLEDQDETPVWRDYCIQFLTECYESSNDKSLIIETIKKYSKGKDSKAGTALLHLALNKQEIDSQQTLAQLEDPKTSIYTRAAILAVWGKTGETDQLPKIREYATQDKVASLKANAIGALGLMGEEQDLVIINKALYHTNGRVVLAAKAAKKRIEARSKE